MRPLRVLLVDDSESFLESAIAFLSRDSRLSIVGSARNGLDGLTMAERLAPDLVLMDLAMPEMDGLAATSLLKAMPVPPRVFLVTLLDTPGYQRRAEAVGADAFIPKTNFAEAVQGALDTLLEVPEQGS